MLEAVTTIQQFWRIKNILEMIGTYGKSLISIALRSISFETLVEKILFVQRNAIARLTFLHHIRFLFIWRCYRLYVYFLSEIVKKTTENSKSRIEKIRNVNIENDKKKILRNSVKKMKRVDKYARIRFPSMRLLVST